MDNNFVSFKDFEKVRLKATYKIEIGSRTIDPGETIVYFDKISIAGLQEIVETIAAKGGFENRSRVFWDRVKELRLQFSQGVFSKEQFALMTNSRLIEFGTSQVVPTTMRETLESDENKIISCKYLPKRNIYIYSKETGEKIEYTQVENKFIIDAPFKEVIIDYEFDYDGNGQVAVLGQKLFSGYVELEGRTRVKDDTTGQVVTGIIKIPRLKLMSDLSLRLGNNASPVVAQFSGMALPTGSRDNSYISAFYFLGDDIDSDL